MADGKTSLWRRRLRKNRGGASRRFQGGGCRQTGGDSRSDNNSCDAALSDDFVTDERISLQFCHIPVAAGEETGFLPDLLKKEPDDFAVDLVDT